MLVISDRVKESSISEGSGSLTLDAPFGSFQSFSQGIGNGNTTYYCIENGTRWEVGQGVYTSVGNTISRDVIFDSSAGGAKINLEGASVVFCTLPADRAIIQNEIGHTFVSGISTLQLNASGVEAQNLSVSGQSQLEEVTISGDLALLGQFIYDGNLSNINHVTTSGDIVSSGFLTLVRPLGDEGNFLHAYKNDGTRQTISLHVDSQLSPLWKFGLKTSPNNQQDPPTFGYVFARDGVAGMVGDLDNYFSISDGLGFTVQNEAHNVMRVSSLTGVYLETNSSANPSFVITGPPLNIEDLTQWRQSDETILSVVDSGGKFGILMDSPEYEIDVNGSGRMETIYLTSGIYFQDGTFQSTAAVPGGGGGGGTGCTFDSDIIVSLADGKTFGRYEDGETIPASGLTPCEVIELASAEPQNPSASLSASPTTIETGTTAVSVNLTFSYTINNLGATIGSVSLEFRRGNTGAWTVLSTDTGLTNYNHSFTNGSADQINYRYVVIDSLGYTVTATRDVSFSYKVFYGPSSSVPATSADVRSLPSNKFLSGDVFTLNTGSTEVNFTVAMPTSQSITEVLDLDALNANITSEYVNNPFNVNDAGGTPVAYNVYTMTIAIPYSSNHRHQVRKA